MSCRQCVGSTTVGTVGPRFWSSLAALVSVSRTIDLYLGTIAKTGVVVARA